MSKSNAYSTCIYLYYGHRHLGYFYEKEMTYNRLIFDIDFNAE
jgi:hypothetical protein